MKLATLLVAALSLAGCVDDHVSTGYAVGGIRPGNKPFADVLPKPTATPIYSQTIDAPAGLGLCDGCQIVAIHTSRVDGLEDVELVKLDGTSICTLVVDEGGIVEDGCGLE